MLITKQNIRKNPINPEDVWAKLEDFAKYGFNKSHAVGYSVISYWTSWLWVHRQEEFLEYMLNYDTKVKYQQAIDKCRELGYKFVFPTIQDMNQKEFKVKDKVVYVPGEAKNNYTSYVDFLFNDNNDEAIGDLIQKGVCDKLTKDRNALVELQSTLLKSYRSKAIYMEPEGETFTKLSEILEGLKMCGAILDYKKENHAKDIRVFVRRFRGAPSQIVFHNDRSDTVKYNICKQDLKKFGVVRKGILSDVPEINTTAIERTIENMKERLIQRGKDERQIFFALKDELDSYMRNYFSNPYRSTFEDVYAVLEEISEYKYSTKCVLNFNNKQDFFYATKENMSKVRLIKKKSLVKLKLIYSPFIKRKTNSYVYDFDIIDIEPVKETVDKLVKYIPEEIEDIDD